MSGICNLQDERHYPHHSELGQIEPVTCIAWIMDKNTAVFIMGDNEEKAEGELLCCGNQDKKNVAEGNFRALFRPDDSNLRYE